MTTQNIFRTTHQANFTVLPNAILTNPNLSGNAKILLAYLLSRPAHWKLRITDVKKILQVGRDKVYKCLHELVAQGYATMERIQKGARWRFYDTPQKQATPEAEADFHFPEIHHSEAQNALERNEIPSLVNKEKTTTAATVCDPRQADESPSVVVSSEIESTVLDETKIVLEEVERLPIESKHKAPIIKTLASVSLAEAKSILLILSRALTMTPISNPIGYTVQLVRASKSGSLTIPSTTSHNIPIAERLKRQEADRKAQEARHQVTNDQWARSMIEMMGLDAFLQIAPWYKPS